LDPEAFIDALKLFTRAARRRPDEWPDTETHQEAARWQEQTHRQTNGDKRTYLAPLPKKLKQDYYDQYKLRYPGKTAPDLDREMSVVDAVHELINILHHLPTYGRGDGSIYTDVEIVEVVKRNCLPLVNELQRAVNTLGLSFHGHVDVELTGALQAMCGKGTFSRCPF
jgi:hypothetical protein